jgi:glycosyltransferase involved in cell wall biosynthesis
MSTTQPLVTIVINNYNYARFLSKAIDSALNQSYPAIEIVVVDDGSTDNSSELIGRYAGRLCHIATQNGGQASALSEGIANSHGEMICFLDSDDYFLDNKIEELVRVFQRLYKETSSFLLYHLLEIVNERGEALGDRIPRHIYNVPENLYEYACKYRFLPYVASPTSGLALSRTLANRIFPLPSEARVCADDFVVRAAALLGRIFGIDKVLGAYRVHGENRWFGNKPLKSVEFMRVMESFLNQKLRENDLAPVVSFFNSSYSRPYSRNRWADIRLAVSVVKHHCDSSTVRFALRTLADCIKRDYPASELATSNVNSHDADSSVS